MKKMVYLDIQELERYQQQIQILRDENENARREYGKLKKELDFLKDSGDEILVIVKDVNKHDTFEYRSTEKELLNNLVIENKDIRDKYDLVIREKDNIENQKQMLLLKYQETMNYYNIEIKELNQYITWLEDRSLVERVKNIKKNRNKENVTSFGVNEIEQTPIKTIYTESEIKHLEEEAKKIDKPRGWHFKNEYIDSEGNVYHKGKLQPHLKKI